MYWAKVRTMARTQSYGARARGLTLATHDTLWRIRRPKSAPDLEKGVSKERASASPMSGARNHRLRVAPAQHDRYRIHR